MASAVPALHHRAAEFDLAAFDDGQRAAQVSVAARRAHHPVQAARIDAAPETPDRSRSIPAWGDIARGCRFARRPHRPSNRPRRPPSCPNRCRNSLRSAGPLRVGTGTGAGERAGRCGAGSSGAPSGVVTAAPSTLQYGTLGTISSSRATKGDSPRCGAVLLFWGHRHFEQMRAVAPANPAAGLRDAGCAKRGSDARPGSSAIADRTVDVAGRYGRRRGFERGIEAAGAHARSGGWGSFIIASGIAIGGRCSAARLNAVRLSASAAGRPAERGGHLSARSCRGACCTGGTRKPSADRNAQRIALHRRACETE